MESRNLQLSYIQDLRSDLVRRILKQTTSLTTKFLDRQFVARTLYSLYVVLMLSLTASQPTPIQLILVYHKVLFCHQLCFFKYNINNFLSIIYFLISSICSACSLSVKVTKVASQKSFLENQLHSYYHHNDQTDIT